MLKDIISIIVFLFLLNIIRSQGKLINELEKENKVLKKKIKIK